MDKVLVEIFVPAENKRYDTYLPRASRISEITLLVSAAFSDLSKGKFIPGGDAVLCDAATGNILDINLSVAELGIKNGSKLMLI